ncbi:MAG: sensor histidine kinase [Gammaproteobacteria bacterium]
MSKVWIAIITSALAVAVLAALIYSSKSVDVNDYNNHYQTVSLIDQSVANYESLLDQLSAARRDGRPTGTGVSLMRGRLTANKEAIVSSTVSQDSSKGYFETQLKKVIELSNTVETQQNSVGSALKLIRDNGPNEVQKLSAAGFETESRAVYKLLLKTLTYGTPGSTSNVGEIDSMLQGLKNNSDLLSSSMVSMIDAIERVRNGRDSVEASWDELAAVPFGSTAIGLRNAINREHGERALKVQNSQTLLNIFSVLLFGGLGLLGFRLHNSYSELNDVNDQLKDANSGLEARVEERTQDLEKAFSELKESQVQLVQAEKMSSLGQLVAGISHEINTPLLYLQSNQTLIKETLSRVSAFVDLSHDKLVPRANPAEDKEVIRKRYVKGLQKLKSVLIDEEIKADLEELVDLTNDNIEGLEELTVLAQGLKDFSRLDRAPIDSFNVNEGIERTLIIAKNVLKSRVNVIKNLNDVPSVSCSPSQINQIFLNLINNAAQAMEDGGDITITTSSKKGFVSVAIQDTGCGIPEEILTKIRDPFFTTKEVGSGTGLGLSICEEILRSHNGRLDIESEVGVGSTFTILLPYKVSEDSSGLSDSVFDDSETFFNDADVAEANAGVTQHASETEVADSSNKEPQKGAVNLALVS